MPPAADRPVILSLQSQVAYGHVGNSAAVFALQRAGFETISIPTILLSHHPGHAPPAHHAISAQLIEQMGADLQRLPAFKRIGAVVSGYLGAADQAPAIAALAAAVKAANPDALYICDPVLGDAPKGLYVDDARAAAICNTLAPRADILTPNLFELGHLTGRDTSSLEAAARAAASLGREIVVTSALPAAASALAVFDGKAVLATAPFTEDAPSSGLGDLFAALYAGARARNEGVESALQTAVGAVSSVAAASRGADEMRLVAAQDTIMRPTATATVAPFSF